MGIIKDTGTVDQYLWVKAQQGIVDVLKAFSEFQASIDSDFAFQVESNLYRPSIETIENTSLVNVRIGQVSSEDATIYDKTHVVTYLIDCYVRGQNETDQDDFISLVPADEVAVRRLMYLCAMVEYVLTNLSNFYMSLSEGEISPGEISLTYNPVEDAEDSATPYAPAQFSFVCRFPYSFKDLAGLPSLEAVKVAFDAWAADITTEDE